MVGVITLSLGYSVTKANLQLALLTDQRKLLLWLHIRRSDNAVLQTMSMLNRSEFTALYSKYSCDVVMLPGKVKNMIWDKFASQVQYFCKFSLLVFNVYTM